MNGAKRSVVVVSAIGVKGGGGYGRREWLAAVRKKRDRRHLTLDCDGIFQETETDNWADGPILGPMSRLGQAQFWTIIA